MSLLTDAPGRFWTLSAARTSYTQLEVGTAEVQLALASTTRAVMVTNTSVATIYFRVDDVEVTEENGMPLYAQQPMWLYVESSTTLRLISGSASQDVRLMEVAA